MEATVMAQRRLPRLAPGAFAVLALIGGSVWTVDS
jgi:hypothetical protein